MSKARQLADLLDSSGDVVTGALDNVPAPSVGSVVGTNGTAGQFLQSDGDGTGTWAEVSGGGKVLQIQQVVFTGTATVSPNNSWIDVSGLSVSITPESTSNKILISYDVQYGGQNSYAGLRAVRNGSVIVEASSTGSRIAAQSLAGSDSYTKFYTSSFTYLDSPNTTSAITYKIQANGATSSWPLYINRSQEDYDGAGNSRGVSVITVMEIAA